MSDKLVGYKGPSLLDPGIIYAPYIPLYKTNTYGFKEFLNDYCGKKYTKANDAWLKIRHPKLYKKYKVWKKLKELCEDKPKFSGKFIRYPKVL